MNYILSYSLTDPHPNFCKYNLKGKFNFLDV